MKNKETTFLQDSFKITILMLDIIVIYDCAILNCYLQLILEKRTNKRMFIFSRNI